MRLTRNQKILLLWLKREGKGKRGRWVTCLPRGFSRTLNSLRARGAVEEKTIELPRSKWPDPSRRGVVGYGYIQHRIAPLWLKAHMPEPTDKLLGHLPTATDPGYPR